MLRALAARAVHEQVVQVELKHAWLMTVLLWAGEVQAIGDAALECTKDQSLRRSVRTLMELVPENLSIPVNSTRCTDPEIYENGDGLVGALLTGIRQGLERHWCELRAIEIIVATIAAEDFDDAELLKQDTRALINDSKAKLAAVHEGILPYVHPFELTEPTDAEVAIVRTLIERAVR